MRHRVVLTLAVFWALLWSAEPRALAQSLPTDNGEFLEEQSADSIWSWKILPDGLLYSSYLAGPKEPRLGYSWAYDTYSRSWVNDATLGARVGLLRLGTEDPESLRGLQLDIEAAAMPRLNGIQQLDLVSADYRVGVPLTWREGPFQAKLSIYHLSSHVGDEYQINHPTFQRINYFRDVFVLGGGWFPFPDLRIYGEVGYAFRTDGGAEPWEFQFGGEYAPTQPTCAHGAPFVATNVYLREEVDWGGTFTLMAGWAWRGKHLFRAGLQYAASETTQWEFLGNSEQLLGFGIWYDF